MPQMSNIFSATIELAFLNVLNSFAVHLGPPVHCFESFYCCMLAKVAVPFMGLHKYQSSFALSRELAMNSEMSSLDFGCTFLVTTSTNF
ncbi:hypothetical protein DSO57_1024794 [Entomophthora muscae]|uniref:Uncharacterized protein n=1 Tax=Entomophthora muscae TaxID=34485 RepID=A0ACC2T2L0_9FUNG|nr:hypothetical protein DSO57_1024794 [Entomophthora muscae]